MITTFEEQPVTPESTLDSLVRAFETAQVRRQPVDLEDFLPATSEPHYGLVLCEIVRLDMEFSWDRGRPNRLEGYRQRFPVLFADPESLREVAFEEYRLRLGHGEAATPEEYESRYQLDCTDWPRLPAAPEPAPAAAMPPSLVPTKEAAGSESIPQEPEDSIRDASIAYAVFRLSRPDADDAEFDSWISSVVDEDGASAVFKDLHHADPIAACRLAQAVATMPETGSRFLDFELVEELGRGTFGRVYLARQGDLSGRLVALKISAELSVESRALAQLQHTHIVPIYSLHRSGPFQAVCMPFFGSTTLADLLKDLKSHDTLPASGTNLVSTLLGKNERTLQTARPGANTRGAGDVAPAARSTVAESKALVSAREVASREVLRTLCDMTYEQAILWIAARVADALAHAHERGILHLDLKPANILLTDQGPMLLDFNLAADTKLHAHASAALLGGTLPYMAPEHLAAFRDPERSVDARCDIYSFGIIVFELLTCRRPFGTPSGPVREILEVMIGDRQAGPPDPTLWNPKVTPAVRAIVRRCQH